MEKIHKVKKNENENLMVKNLINSQLI